MKPITQTFPSFFVCLFFTFSQLESLMLLFCKMGWFTNFAQSGCCLILRHSSASKITSCYKEKYGHETWRCIWPSSRGQSVSSKVYLNNNNERTKIMRRKRKQIKRFTLTFPAFSSSSFFSSNSKATVMRCCLCSSHSVGLKLSLSDWKSTVRFQSVTVFFFFFFFT